MQLLEGIIEDVVLTPLKQIPDERGKIMHLMRNDDPYFEKFGEVYVSIAYPGVVKGWHVHKEMTLNYACILGMIKLVLYDLRNDSSTHGFLMELFIGESNYVRVQIPPGIVNGFKTISTKAAYVVNIASTLHDPAEIDRHDPHDLTYIPYDWKRRDK